MPTPDVENVVIAIDPDRIHQAQILAPGLASHDGGNDPTQEATSISSVFGDKAGTAHDRHLCRGHAARRQCSFRTVPYSQRRPAENEIWLIVSEICAVNPLVSGPQLSHFASQSGLDAARQCLGGLSELRLV
ncbi:hypothetical protein [Bradyrhizobium centrolobii]|uniref:hypothetical protein n=1 Tax=Bradyrhizobium centrolobii TaxID=1505087 RepID=UPI001FD9870A|nr:hypothetical protein [Bradyrhizobium centrolobii]